MLPTLISILHRLSSICRIANFEAEEDEEDEQSDIGRVSPSLPMVVVAEVDHNFHQLERSATASLERDVEAYEADIKRLKLRQAAAVDVLENRRLEKTKLEDALKAAGNTPITFDISDMGGCSIEVEAAPADDVWQLKVFVAAEFGYAADAELELLCGTEILAGTTKMVQLCSTNLIVVMKPRSDNTSEITPNTLLDEGYVQRCPWAVSHAEGFETYCRRIADERGGIFSRLSLLTIFLFLTVTFGVIAVLSLSRPYMDNASRWSSLQPQPCQPLQVACIEKGYERTLGSYNVIRIYYALQEGPETPSLREIGSVRTEVSTADGRARIIESGDAKVSLSGRTSETTLWVLRPLDTSPKQLLPDALHRGIRIHMVSKEGHLLRASTDGSVVDLAPEGAAENIRSEWILSTRSGKCCFLYAAGVESSRRYLGPANRHSVVELWPEEDAALWMLQNLSPQWDQYLMQPAPVGTYEFNVPAEKTCDDRTSDCVSVVGINEIEAAAGMPPNSLFSPNLRCYAFYLPTLHGTATGARSDNIKYVSQFENMPYRAHLRLYNSLFLVGMIGSYLSIACQITILQRFRPERKSNTTACLALTYVLLFGVVVSMGPLLWYSSSGMVPDLAYSTAIEPEEGLWVERWNASASHYRTGDSEEKTYRSAGFGHALSTPWFVSIVAVSLALH